MSVWCLLLWIAGGCCGVLPDTSHRRTASTFAHQRNLQRYAVGMRASAYACLLSCCPAAAVLARAGAKLLWGGQPLTGHTIPECYGAIQPTAVFVPLASMQDPAVFKLVTTEVFGPFQVISEFEGAVATGRRLRLSRQVTAAACLTKKAARRKCCAGDEECEQHAQALAARVAAETHSLYIFGKTRLKLHSSAPRISVVCAPQFQNAPLLLLCVCCCFAAVPPPPPPPPPRPSR